ncbi:DNA polymerase III subunit beta [Klebsiella pneumoniae subsp. ozaenae]|uniref:DNA polymerase III subunit beta n=1 Tax=Klebsiella pneumoniae subsp. ozaenae TaxID=574 RepID=A0A378AUC6_KLEPO|nr:DNA polymerase III subunit beta [Klebsiella pneumoniae subsp. ozaenae]
MEFTLPQATMKRLIEATQFSMAHQDVRYYLNGMLFETEGSELRTVAHRWSPPGGLFDAAGSVAAEQFGDRAA